MTGQTRRRFHRNYSVVFLRVSIRSIVWLSIQIDSVAIIVCRPINVFDCVSGVDDLAEMRPGTIGRFTRVVFDEEYKLGEKVVKRQFGFARRR